MATGVGDVEGYFYAGYGIWALRPGASASVPSTLPAARWAVPELPLRDGRGGPKAEPAAAASEYVAVETQGKASAAPGPAPQKQKQEQSEKSKQKAQPKKAVGEPVDEMSDADMAERLRAERLGRLDAGKQAGGGAPSLRPASLRPGGPSLRPAAPLAPPSPKRSGSGPPDALGASSSVHKLGTYQYTKQQLIEHGKT